MCISLFCGSMIRMFFIALVSSYLDFQRRYCYTWATGFSVCIFTLSFFHSLRKHLLHTHCVLSIVCSTGDSVGSKTWVLSSRSSICSGVWIQTGNPAHIVGGSNYGKLPGVAGILIGAWIINRSYPGEQRHACTKTWVKMPGEIKVRLEDGRPIGRLWEAPRVEVRKTVN